MSLPAFGNMLRWSGSRIQLTSAGGAGAATALPTGQFVEIRATQDCFIRFGDGSIASTVDGNSILFLRGAQTVMVPGALDANNRFVPFTHVSVRNAGGDDGIVQIERIY